MAMKSCYECNKEISTEAIVCPQCGVPQKKGPLGKQALYSIALIYSVLFWGLFHPYWTSEWVGVTRGSCIPSSNFMCWLIYAGGFFLWDKFFYSNWCK